MGTMKKRIEISGYPLNSSRVHFMHHLKNYPSLMAHKMYPAMEAPEIFRFNLSEPDIQIKKNPAQGMKHRGDPVEYYLFFSSNVRPALAIMRSMSFCPMAVAGVQNPPLKSFFPISLNRHTAVSPSILEVDP